MSLAVFSSPTPIEPYRGAPLRETTIVRFAGAGSEGRASPTSREFWRWVLRFRLTDANLATLAAFFLARGQQGTSFLWKPLKAVEYARTAIALGTSTLTQTVFSLPTSGQYAGDYPVDDANCILKSDGTPISKTVQTDARTITAAVAPGSGHVITADYYRYARVRLDGAWDFSEPVYSASEVGSLALLEVVA